MERKCVWGKFLVLINQLWLHFDSALRHRVHQASTKTKTAHPQTNTYRKNKGEHSYYQLLSQLFITKMSIQHSEAYGNQ